MKFFHKFNKFKAQQTSVNGIKFPSKREAKYYEELELREKAGDVVFFLRQVPFHLQGGIRYIVDFVIFEKDGSVRFVDVKGFKTPMYKAKKKMVEAIYPIQIEEV